MDRLPTALRRSHPSDRHHHLLRLGEAGLAYLASLAFADYRQARRGNPDAAVENWIAQNTRVTAGEYLQLFRITQKALGRPEIFGIKRYEVNTKLEHAARLVAAIAAVDYAQRVGATDVSVAIEEGLRSPSKSVRWLSFWNDFVTYRNRVIHADDKGWPIDADGYFERMTPLLEAAVVEALTTEYIAHVLLEYPVARLADVTRVGGEWVLAFDGDYRGAPLIEKIRQRQPPEDWQLEVGSDYVLAADDAGRRVVHAPFWDLKRGSAPTPAPVKDAAANGPRPADVGVPQEEEPSKGEPLGAERTHDLEKSLRSPPPVDEPILDEPAIPLRSSTATPVAAGPAAQPSVGTPIIRTDGEPWFRFFSPWILWGLLSFGLLAGVGFLAVSMRIRDPRLRNWGLVYMVLATVVLVIAVVVGESNQYPVLDAVGMTLFFAIWVVSTVHALAINPRVRREHARLTRSGDRGSKR